MRLQHPPKWPLAPTVLLWRRGYLKWRSVLDQNRCSYTAGCSQSCPGGCHGRCWRGRRRTSAAPWGSQAGGWRCAAWRGGDITGRSTAQRGPQDGPAQDPGPSLKHAPYSGNVQPHSFETHLCFPDSDRTSVSPWTGCWWVLGSHAVAGGWGPVSGF